jgi:hypothetical protein
MANQLSRLLMCVVLVGFTSVFAMAQDTSEGTKSKDAVRTVTGCLTKSGGGDEYRLTGNDGSTWEVHNADSSVDLASHVDQTVEAKGVVKHSKAHNMKEDSKDMASDAGVRTKAEHGHLTITELHTVSKSCESR